MKIIKTSSTQITPEVGQICNDYQQSGVNTYSCNYVNTHTDYIVETRIDTTQTTEGSYIKHLVRWYRKHSDGWLEQGGTLQWTGTGSIAPQKASFLLPFKDTNYSLSTAGTRTDGSPYNGFVSSLNFNTTDFCVNTADDTTSNPGTVKWYACGFGPEE